MVNIPLRRLFTYKIDKNSSIQPVIGMRVEVSFAKKIKIGIIARIGVEESTSYKIHSIHRIIDSTPLVGASLIQLSQWMQSYYHAYPSDVWKTLLPKALLKGQMPFIIRDSFWRLTILGQTALNEISTRAFKQRRTMLCLKEYPNTHTTDFPHNKINEYDLSSTVLKTLADKKWVEHYYPKESDHTLTASSKHFLHPNYQPLRLNAQQKEVIEQIKKKSHEYQTWLLLGVTASGKTEVYLQLVESILLQKKQALILVPEIGLTPQTLFRFKARFQVTIVMMHSKMSESQRLQVWLKGQSGIAQIIIGTRSALFIPLKAPGIIILDEEHDSSFKQQQALRYSARDIAMVRGKLENIPVLLASATPSIETLVNVQKKKIIQLNLTQKVIKQTPLTYHVIDMTQQPIKHGLSYHVIHAIKHHLQQKGQILLFLNRRGYSPVLLCHECGWSSECQRCERHFTLHNYTSHYEQYLQCHHCGSSKKVPVQCENCQGKTMVPVGLGTERLEESIRTLFPKAKVQRIDRDTTQKKWALKGYLDSIESGQTDILIGTQMLAKGHHFPNITLVALLDIDGSLYSANFRAPESAAQLIIQVSGRAGRAHKKGEVLIQTHLPQHPMFSVLLNKGYSHFSELIIQERKRAHLPPFTFSALIQAEGLQTQPIITFLGETKTHLKNAWLRIQKEDHVLREKTLELLGPVPAFFEKKAGHFRYQLYIQSQQRGALHHVIDEAIQTIEALSSGKRVKWRLEIDPIE
jgi:primosomal protein N' (replication factor Y)